jgi:hypothetical protein
MTATTAHIVSASGKRGRKMKTLKQGQKVKLIDPAGITARFYVHDHRAIIGAGNMIVPRIMLYGDAWIFAITKDTDSVLVVFGQPESNIGIWLDTDSIEEA